jgi:hypothetical protein
MIHPLPNRKAVCVLQSNPTTHSNSTARLVTWRPQYSLKPGAQGSGVGSQQHVGLGDSGHLVQRLRIKLL